MLKHPRIFEYKVQPDNQALAKGKARIQVSTGVSSQCSGSSHGKVCARMQHRPWLTGRRSFHCMLRHALERLLLQDEAVHVLASGRKGLLMCLLMCVCVSCLQVDVIPTPGSTAIGVNYFREGASFLASPVSPVPPMPSMPKV